MSAAIIDKYDKQLTPKENMRILIRQLQNPHAEGVLACPTYLDFVHAYDKSSSRFVTDNLFETLNDFELSVEDKIQHRYRSRVSRQHFATSSNH